MSRTSLVTLTQESIDEEALEKKREEAVKMLSQKLRAEGSQTINEYCLSRATETIKAVAATPNSNSTINGQKETGPKRVSPVTAAQRSPSDGPSPEKRTRSTTNDTTSSSPSPPLPPLIKLMGRGRGRKQLVLEHTRSYVSQLHEVAQAMMWHHASFEHTRTGYPPHELFVVSCKLNGQEYFASEATVTKKQGNELAALEALKSILGDSP